MELKSKLQLMLQIVEQAELNGGLAEIERDILLNELREAYTALKFGGVELAEPKACEEETPAVPVAPEIPAEETEEENEVEVELIFDETEEAETDEEADEEVVYEAPAEEPTEESIEEPIEEPTEEPIEEVVEEPIVETPAVEESAEPIAEEPAEDEYLTAIRSQHATPKHNAILSLYEDTPAPVVGEQFQETISVADSIACPKGVAESAPITSLHGAIGVADKFMLIRELFDGDGEAYDVAIDALESQPSFEDSIIYISENYSWPPHAEGTKLMMELLQRKYNV